MPAAAESASASSHESLGPSGLGPSLSGRRDFEGVYSRGRRFRGAAVRFVWCRNTLGVTRLGFSVSGRLGGSVDRNRFKRRARELARAMLPAGFDVVIGVGRTLEEASWAAMTADFEEVRGLLVSQDGPPSC